MAKTVDSAFVEYMRDYVNLAPNVVDKAKASKKNLLDNIHDFSNDDFFNLCSKFDIEFGSFARKTKCRELDDIDLMIGISADGATYNSINGWDKVKISASDSNQLQKECKNEDGTLNSTKVLNRFKKKLEYIHDYSRSDLHRNGEAVTLNLISRDWAFDIVPCFHTVKDEKGYDYYLIPNKDGDWKLTDPKMDKFYIDYIDKEKSNKLKPLIRLCKKWNEYKNVITLPSYLMETMLFNFGRDEEMKGSIKFNFFDALSFMSKKIYEPIYDMKGIQGDINTISYTDKKSFSEKCKSDMTKCSYAIEYEFEDENQCSAINKWREIFGEDFPRYE